MSNQNQKPKSKSRRKFLLRGGLGTIGVLALGTYVFRNPLRRQILGMSEEMIPPYSGSGTEANLWIEILADNQVRIHSPKVEMGQGTFTGFAQIVADEMDLDIEAIDIVAAETKTGIVDALSTGGSLSVAQLYLPLREMAATMRLFLMNEAAKQLGAEASKLSFKGGQYEAGGKKVGLTEVASNITEWKLPDTPPLKASSAFKYIGKPVKRIDQLAKIKGEPIFGMDASLPNMLHATVVRPEHIGAKIKSVDTSEAEKMPGVVQIIQKEDWVGILAESFPEALMAKRKVKVEWDIPKEWTEEDIRSMLTVGKGNKMVTQKKGSALEDDKEETVSLEFSSPLGAHAQMEPNGALASFEDGKVSVTLSTQVIGVTQKQVAKALDIPLENVNIIGTYLGGGFGRRLNTSHAVKAAILSKEVGRPVKYFFTRKEEFQNDTFRPPTHHVVKGKLNDEGYLDSLEHHYASGDVAINSVIMPPGMSTILGTDVGAMRGGNVMYGNIPNSRSVQWHTTLPFATSWWRSLGLLANTFAIESFIDEMALKAGKHPVDFRLKALSNEGSGPRIKKVIEEAARIANYKDKADENRAMGIAASIDANSACAHVAEVRIEDGQIRVEKVTCVLDCGLAVNPDQVKAQCEGSIIMGLSASMHEKMTLRDGRLFPINYGSYDIALMKDSPKEIDVHLIQGVDEPLPVGEPPLGPIGAAIGNAVRRITGQRITDLPMRLA